jgi:hypothetical protein
MIKKLIRNNFLWWILAAIVLGVLAWWQPRVKGNAASPVIASEQSLDADRQLINVRGIKFTQTLQMQQALYAAVFAAPVFDSTAKFYTIAIKDMKAFTANFFDDKLLADKKYRDLLKEQDITIDTQGISMPVKKVEGVYCITVPADFLYNLSKELSPGSIIADSIP